MDTLLQTLLARQMEQPARSPTQTKRFETANTMQDAYRAGWDPNPILLKLLMNRG